MQVWMFYGWCYLLEEEFEAELSGCRALIWTPIATAGSGSYENTSGLKMGTSLPPSEGNHPPPI